MAGCWWTVELLRFEMKSSVITESAGTAQIQHGRSGGVERMLVTKSAPRGIFAFAGSGAATSSSAAAAAAAGAAAAAASSAATVDLWAHAERRRRLRHRCL